MKKPKKRKQKVKARNLVAKHAHGKGGKHRSKKDYRRKNKRNSKLEG